MIRKDNSAAWHVSLHEADEVAMHLALNLIENWDARSSTVHAEGPSDLFGKFSTEMPSSTSDFCFINLDWTFKLEVGQYSSMHVVVTGLSEK